MICMMSEQCQIVVTFKIVSSSFQSPLLGQFAEGGQDLLIELFEALLEVVIGILWHLELHGSKLNELLLAARGDGVPANLVVATALSDCLLATLMEAHNVPHHTDGLGQWAPEVILTEAVLLQEIFTDNLCNVKSALLILREGVLADQLHDLLQVIFLLENLLHFLLKEAILGVKLLKERLQDADVLGEGDVPVDRREMLTLCKLLVQAPEDLHNAQSCRGHWVCEVTSWRRHSTNNGDRSFSLGIANAPA